MSQLSADAQPDLLHHRAKIARVLLVGFAVLGLFAYVPSVWLSLHVGIWGIAALNTVVYGAILGVLAFGRHSYRLQASVVVAVCLVLSVVLSATLGPSGAGPLWLLATPIVAAILFDRRAAILTLCLVGVSFAVITALALGGRAPWSEHPVTSVVLWVVLGANALLLGGALSLAVTTLIRELQQEMAERHRAETQLRQAEKLQAIGTLSAGIAHDFNNLLTPILLSTEMARADSTPDSAQRLALDQAFEAAIAARLLVRRILAFSRPSGEGRTDMQASDAFRDAVRLLRAAIPGSTAVNLTVMGDGAVRLSSEEVHQIVLNLGTNAHRAMPGGGTIDIRLTELAGADVDWSGGSPRPERLVRLVVSDTGCGMPPHVVSRVFEPFFTTDQDGGTGIGLPTVHGIVTSVGGQIGCRSTPGAGTTFTLDFPAIAAPSASPSADVSILAEPPSPAPAPPPSGGAVSAAVCQHVLVVDDEKPVRDVVQRLLQRQGFRVTPLPEPAAALELLRGAAGSVSLILSDLNMPGMTGLQLAELVRAEHPTVGFILMSGLVDETLEAEAKQAGVHHIVAKPFELHEMVGAVRAVCGTPTVDGPGSTPPAAAARSSQRRQSKWPTHERPKLHEGP